MDHKVPKLILQPLVENAFYHGIKPLRSEGRIIVSAKAVGDDLIITVADNGVGMSAETLRAVRESLNDNIRLTSRHIGVNNVQMRVKIIFGNEYGVSVSSAEYEGTVFTIKLPVG